MLCLLPHIQGKYFPHIYRFFFRRAMPDTGDGIAADMPERNTNMVNVTVFVNNSSTFSTAFVPLWKKNILWDAIIHKTAMPRSMSIDAFLCVGKTCVVIRCITLSIEYFERFVGIIEMWHTIN